MNVNYYGIVNPDGVEADLLGFAETRDVTVSSNVVQCYPLPESKLVIKPQFEPTEIMPETGEKSPANPSKIEGKPSVLLQRCGHNIIPESHLLKIPYVTVSDLEYQGLAGNLLRFNFLNNTLYGKNTIKFSIDYSVSRVDYQKASVVIECRYQNTSGKTFGLGYQTVYADKGFFHLSWTFTDSNVKSIWLAMGYNHYYVFKNVQIEICPSEQKYYPYEGDTYAIDLGAEYGGGYLDLERGKFVQMYILQKLNELEWGNSSISNETTLALSTDLIYKSRYNNAYEDQIKCTHYPIIPPKWEARPSLQVAGGYAETGFAVLLLRQDRSSPSTMNLDQWKAFLQDQESRGTPVCLTYELKFPIEHDITSQLIRALPQGDFHGNKLNNIFCDTNLPTEVTYKEPVVYFPIKEV